MPELAEPALRVSKLAVPPVQVLPQSAVPPVRVRQLAELPVQVRQLARPLLVLKLAEPGVKLILDMTQVSFMSSAGLRMLLVLYRTVRGRGGKILLVGLSEDLRNTMSLTGFLDLFHHHPTLEAGLTELAAGPKTV